MAEAYRLLDKIECNIHLKSNSLGSHPTVIILCHEKIFPQYHIKTPNNHDHHQFADVDGFQGVSLKDDVCDHKSPLEENVMRERDGESIEINELLLGIVYISLNSRIRSFFICLSRG